MSASPNLPQEGEVGSMPNTSSVSYAERSRVLCLFESFASRVPRSRTRRPVLHAAWVRAA